MFCEKCGGKLEDNWKRCSHCGQPIESEAEHISGRAPLPSSAIACRNLRNP